MYYYIINPAAGRGAIDSIQPKLKALLQSLGIDGEFAKTTGPGDATTIARRAMERGFKTIVAVGGDTTVGEVIKAVYQQANPKVAVGVVPIGRQNQLAARLGLSEWRMAAQVLAERRLSTYQLLTANGQPFIFSCRVSPGLAEGETAPPPVFEYLAEIDRRYKVRGQASTLEAWNQKFLSPALENQLLIKLFVPPSASSGLRQLLHLFDTSAALSFSQLHAKRFTVESPQSLQLQVDGQVLAATKLTLKLQEATLRLITARETAV